MPLVTSDAFAPPPSRDRPTLVPSPRGDAPRRATPAPSPRPPLARWQAPPWRTRRSPAAGRRTCPPRRPRGPAAVPSMQPPPPGTDRPTPGGVSPPSTAVSIGPLARRRRCMPCCGPGLSPPWCSPRRDRAALRRPRGETATSAPPPPRPSPPRPPSPARPARPPHTVPDHPAPATPSATLVVTPVATPSVRHAAPPPLPPPVAPCRLGACRRQPSAPPRRRHLRARLRQRVAAGPAHRRRSPLRRSHALPPSSPPLPPRSPAPPSPSPPLRSRSIPPSPFHPHSP